MHPERENKYTYFDKLEKEEQRIEELEEEILLFLRIEMAKRNQ